MLRWILISLVLLLASCGQSSQDKIREARESIHIIYGGTPDRITGKASGICVNSNYILTANHVTKFPGKLFTHINEKPYSLKRLWHHKKLDVSLLKIVGAACKSAIISCRQPSLLENMVIIASPGRGKELLISTGIISREHTRNGEFVLNATSGAGASGGAVLDKEGRVVGVVVAIYIMHIRRAFYYGADFTLVVPIRLFCTDLKKVIEKDTREL